MARQPDRGRLGGPQAYTRIPTIVVDDCVTSSYLAGRYLPNRVPGSLFKHGGSSMGWGGGACQRVSDLRGRNGRHQGDTNGEAPRSSGDAVSWLVGGPARLS